MDIFAYARKNDFRDDFYDYDTGWIYLIREFKELYDRGFLLIGIRVIDAVTGETIGYEVEDWD